MGHILGLRKVVSPCPSNRFAEVVFFVPTRYSCILALQSISNIMSNLDFSIFFLASVWVGIGIFAGLLLFRFEKGNPFSNQLVGLIFLFLSLRIGKSILYNFIELPLFIKNLGLSLNLTLGPLLYFYGLSLFNNISSLKSKDILHFIPALVYALFCWIIPNDTESVGWKISYSFILVQAFVYLGASSWLWYVSTQKDSKSSWYLMLSLGFWLIQITYFLIFIGVIPIYSAGLLSFIIFFTLLGLRMVLNSQWAEQIFLKKYSTSVLSDQKIQTIMEKVMTQMKHEKVFLNPNITLNSMARKVDTNSKFLSQAINVKAQKNFSQFINAYRVNHAKKLLSHPDRQHEKIISIALDSGFKSLSSFNSVFKNYTQMTPSEYKESYLSYLS